MGEGRRLSKVESPKPAICYLAFLTLSPSPLTSFAPAHRRPHTTGYLAARLLWGIRLLLACGQQIGQGHRITSKSNT